MSNAALAKRSGVSLPTVVRVLSGRNANASLQNVAVIAEALGLRLSLESDVDVAEVREEQARRKAQRLVGIVQGTSGLEAQALDDRVLGEMTRQTVHELLAGSPQKLWGE